MKSSPLHLDFVSPGANGVGIDAGARIITEIAEIVGPTGLFDQVFLAGVV
jgi:hypothetical protein